MHLKITPIYIYPQLHHHFFSSSSSSSLQLFFSFFFFSIFSAVFYSYHYHCALGYIIITLYIPLSYPYPYYHCGVSISSLASLSSTTSTSPLSLCIYNLRHARRPNAPANIAFAFSLYRCSLLLASANNNTSNNSATSRRYAHQNRLPTKALPSNLLAPENFWPFDNWSLSFAGCCFSYRQ